MLAFLMETKGDKHKMEAIRAKLEYEGLFKIVKSGQSGGLTLFWKHINILETKVFSQSHIDTEIKMRNTTKSRLTCFYGYPE